MLSFYKYYILYYISILIYLLMIHVLTQSTQPCFFYFSVLAMLCFSCCLDLYGSGDQSLLHFLPLVSVQLDQIKIMKQQTNK